MYLSGELAINLCTVPDTTCKADILCKIIKDMLIRCSLQLSYMYLKGRHMELLICRVEGKE